MSLTVSIPELERMIADQIFPSFSNSPEQEMKRISVFFEMCAPIWGEWKCFFPIAVKVQEKTDGFLYIRPILEVSVKCCMGGEVIQTHTNDVSIERLNEFIRYAKLGAFQ